MTTGGFPNVNDASLQLLLAALGRVRSSDCLFVSSSRVLRALNLLTPFLTLKSRAEFLDSLKLESLVARDNLNELLKNYSGVILAIDLQDIPELVPVWSALSDAKLHVIVRNLTRTFYYKFGQLALANAGSDLQFNRAVDFDALAPVIRLGRSRIIPWKCYPLEIADGVYSLDMELPIALYFGNPLEQILTLADGFVEVMELTCESLEHMAKIKNAFAKGDHAALLLNTLLNNKLPEMLAEKFTPAQREFFDTRFRGNADVVVLERNLDYAPLLLTPTSYWGILDHVIGTSDEVNGILRNGKALKDDLFSNLQHLNFGLITQKLNQLARYIQQEWKNGQNLTDLAEIKALVASIGNLSTTKDLVTLHTQLSEDVLDNLERNTSGDIKYNVLGAWLELQNSIFELDYLRQMAQLRALLNQYTPFAVAISAICVVSLANDGIKQSDLDYLESSIMQNFGLEAAMTFLRLLDLKLVRAANKGLDFFSAFTFSKTEIETTTTSTAGGTKNDTNDDSSCEDPSLLGKTGAQEGFKSTYTLISKFWNLHPLDEEEPRAIESVEDYLNPTFALPGVTVPLLARFVEALYSRAFLKYKPVNSTSRRPNWDGLNMETMFRGQTVDKNISDSSDNRKLTRVDPEGDYCFVLVLGGITRSEISVFKYLEKKVKRRLIILTPGLVNNEGLIKAAKEE